jgi:hypothetical protein
VARRHLGSFSHVNKLAPLESGRVAADANAFWAASTSNPAGRLRLG